LFVIPEIHIELSGIPIAGYTLVRQSTNKKPRVTGPTCAFLYTIYPHTHATPAPHIDSYSVLFCSCSLPCFWQSAVVSGFSCSSGLC